MGTGGILLRGGGGLPCDGQACHTGGSSNTPRHPNAKETGISSVCLGLWLNTIPFTLIKKYYSNINFFAFYLCRILLHSTHRIPQIL